MGGGHSLSNWRYKVIKRYRRRATDFQERAITPEEYLAWGKVIEWFNSILKHRYLNENQAICLPEMVDQDDLKGGG